MRQAGPMGIDAGPMRLDPGPTRKAVREQHADGAPTRGAKAAFLAGILALTALALWMVWPAFRSGRIINLDAPRHLLRSFVMMKQFLPSGHVDGLSPWWYLGAQLFLFQSYGYFFLIGGTALVLSSWHLATLPEVFKFYYVLPIVLLPGA